MLLFLSLLMPASLHAMVGVASQLPAPGSFASSRALASSTVCSILEPLLPTDLGCSCASAESGVGGSATCSLSTPAVEIIASMGVPSITFQAGAEALPCGDPASAKVHASVTIPGFAELPDVIKTAINTIAEDSTKGLSIEDDELVFSQEVKAGEEYIVDVPFYSLAFASFDFRMLMTVKGNVGGFTIEQSVDMCIKFGEGEAEVELCGADLPTCNNNWADSAEQAMCIASGFFDFHAAFKSPPYEVLEFTGAFTNVCSAGGSGGGSNPAEEYEIEAAFTADGEIGDFTDAKKTEIADVFATASGVAANDITVNVAAASVRISVTMPVTGESEATALVDTLENGIMKNPYNLNEAFASTTIGGSAIESVSTVKTTKKGGDGGGLGGGAIAGVVIGVLCALSILGAGVYLKMRSASDDDAQKASGASI